MRPERWQVKGRIGAWIARDAARSAEVRVQQILEVAVDAWRRDGFHSYDRTENSLTVRLYKYCKDAIRDYPDFSLFDVRWEAPQPATEILRGEAAPATSARPDVGFSVGQRLLLLEAKRLDGGTTLYREYVGQGMTRFWDAKYVSDPGLLIAYLIGPSQEEAVRGINAAIDKAHAQTSSDDRHLKGTLMLRSGLSKSTSVYPDEGVIWHFALRLELTEGRPASH